MTAACVVALATGTAQADDEVKDPALAAAALQKAQADARQADASASKAETDARKAALDLRSAEREANQNLLPNSGKSSSISAKEAAGQTEATLLANYQLAQLSTVAAASISASIDRACSDCATRKIVILTANDDVSLSHLRTYDLRRAIVTKTMERANESYNKAVSENAGAFIIGPALATTVVQLASAASYAAASSEVGGVSVSPSDRALIAALAKSLSCQSGKNEIYLASRAATPAATKTVTDELAALDDLAHTTAKNLADAKARGAAARKGKKGDAADKAAKPWDDVAANLGKAVEAYNAFVELLADDKGGMPLGLVLREKGLGEVLSDPKKAFQVIPTYVAAGGGYYTQTNLWTVGFGLVPFHVSGGSAIAYEVLRADTGQSIDSGTVENESSYVPVRKVAEKLSGGKSYGCPKPSDQSKKES